MLKSFTYRTSILLPKKYTSDPQQDKETEHEARFGWNVTVKHGRILLVSLFFGRQISVNLFPETTPSLKSDSATIFTSYPNL